MTTLFGVFGCSISGQYQKWICSASYLMHLVVNVWLWNSWKNPVNGDQYIKTVTKYNLEERIIKADLYGTWQLLVAKEDITSPRAESDLLMFWASLSLSPCTSVLASLSLPAKSTSHSLLFVHSLFTKFFALTIMQSMLYEEIFCHLSYFLINHGAKSSSRNKKKMIWMIITSGIGYYVHSHCLILQLFRCFQPAGHPRPP